MVTDPIRQFQAAVHLLPQKLSSLGRHCKGSVVQISAQVAQGIADATPVIWREIGGVVVHLFKLSLTAGHGSGVIRVASASRPVTARKDDASAAVQAAIVNVAGVESIAAGGGLIQTTSG